MLVVIPAFVPADGVVEVAITIAVMVIAFIGWLVQIIGQAKGPQPGPANRPGPAAPRPAAAPGKPRDERLQSEIDAFLREVATGRKPEPVEEDAIEIIEDDEPERRPRRVAPAGPVATSGPAGRPPSPVVGQPSERDREPPRRHERPVPSLAERHLEAAPLGAELRKHVEQQLSESVQLRHEKEQAERRLAETRAELQAMRGQTAAGPAAAAVSAGGPRGTSRISDLLKNRRSVKDAIVINEVLGRPKGMTRRR